MGVGEGRAGEMEYEGAGGNFRGNECLHYLDCGDCFMGVHIYQNLSNWTL